MTDRESPTVDEIRARFGEMLWAAVERMATDHDPIGSLTFLTKRLPIGALQCTPLDEVLARTTPRGLLSADHFRAHCTRVVIGLLDRPDVRAQLRGIEESPSRAKRHKRVLAIARATRPEIFSEPAPKAVSSAISVKGASQPEGSVVRFPDGSTIRYGRNAVTITTRTPCAESADIARLRAKCRESYNARVPLLEQIATDPNVSEKDRRYAQRVRKKYKHLEPKDGA